MRFGGALGAVLALIAGCSPQYQTFTSYTPPPTEAGQYCVANCFEARRLCRREKSLEVQHCRGDARAEAEARNERRLQEFHIDLARYHAGLLEQAPERPHTVSPNFAACTRRDQDLEADCTQDFDLCYQNCGGTVTYATHCVAHCD